MKTPISATQAATPATTATLPAATGASTGNDTAAVGDMLRALRRRHLEPVWERFNHVDDARYATLWLALQDTGLTGATLPEDDGGVPLDNASLIAALRELGAAVPALAAALVSHLSAQALLVEAGNGRWPGTLPTHQALALLASPLDVTPATGFRLERRGRQWTLSGKQRVLLPAGAACVLPARGTGGLLMCALAADTHGLSFTMTPSSHGLCLLPFGELVASDVILDDAQVFDWPASGIAANTADALLTALAAGMLDELALRASDYARQRVQAGKPISEHHAVQHLLGSLEMARRPVQSLALATLAQPRAGDGSSAAFAISLLRRGALDAIQVFGGYGYMEDYRVERYLRDANTLETFWVHAAQRERDLVLARCAALARGEAA